MQITSSNNSNINFSGATRTLRRNYFATKQEIVDVFEKYPKADGIAGSLPYSWLKNIINQPKEEKGKIIKQVYSLFRNIFEQNYSTKKQMTDISSQFTEVLRALKIIPLENQIIIKKRKLDGGVLRGAYVIQERGKTKTLEPLFVKQFVDKSKQSSVNTEGSYAELALGLHLHQVINDEHIIRPYFGDTKAKFMVSKYEIAPQGVKIPRKLTKAEAFDDMYILEYIQELQNISGDHTNIRSLLFNHGFYHKDFHDENVLITRNQKGDLIVKLIDLGKIVRIGKN